MYGSGCSCRNFFRDGRIYFDSSIAQAFRHTGGGFTGRRGQRYFQRRIGGKQDGQLNFSDGSGFPVPGPPVMMAKLFSTPVMEAKASCQSAGSILSIKHVAANSLMMSGCCLL